MKNFLNNEYFACAFTGDNTLRTVTLQLKDASGNNLAKRAKFILHYSDSQYGLPTPIVDEGISFVSGLVLGYFGVASGGFNELSINDFNFCETDENGTFVFEVATAHTADAVAFYLMIGMHGETNQTFSSTIFTTTT
jgi:hypothetical protein